MYEAELRKIAQARKREEDAGNMLSVAKGALENTPEWRAVKEYEAAHSATKDALEEEMDRLKNLVLTTNARGKINEFMTVKVREDAEAKVNESLALRWSLRRELENLERKGNEWNPIFVTLNIPAFVDAAKQFRAFPDLVPEFPFDSVSFSDKKSLALATDLSPLLEE